MSEIKNSIVTLQPGIYILRHSKEGGRGAISVSRAAIRAFDAGKIETLSTPKTQGSLLRDGADCIVMQVSEGSVDLLVTAYLTQSNAAEPLLKIDKVSLDAEMPQIPAPVQAVAPSTPAFEISNKGLSIIGHIERTGDVLASGDQCLGEPTSNLRLEGFQIMWPDRPEGIDLGYSVSLEGVGATPMVNTGKFCGTRNEAKRINEVMFILIGAKATQFQLKGTAYFSGGFQVPVSSGMALTGPSGLEHLTAISLGIEPSISPKKATTNPWDESPRTQVFKAKETVTPKTRAKKIK